MASEEFSRRTLAHGVAWSVPAIALAGATPAVAASVPPFLTLQHDVLAGCVSTSGIADVYYYLNVLNNSGSAYTLTEPLVITLINTNPNRNKLRPSTSNGTLSGSGNQYVWVLPPGFVIPANSDVDMLWHFLSHAGQPTSVTATTTSPLVTNPTSNSAAGYGNGCTGQF